MRNKYSVFSLIKNALSYHENWQRAWKDPTPKKEYDVVIIGGGGHGLATAYYLAKEHKITNVAMAFENNLDKIYGFQFHPESFLTINGNLLIKKILST